MEEGKVVIQSIEGLKTATALKEVKNGGETSMVLMTKVAFEAEMEPSDIAELHRLLAGGHMVSVEIGSPQLSMPL